MKRNPLTAPLRFWRHLGYHREIIKHLRWTRGDARRFAFYQGLIRPGELVFDVGANMGNRSKIFRAIGARVAAFEPQSYCATFLRAAFSGDKDFTLVQTAMSDCEGEQEMFLSDTHVLSTLNTDWLERMRQGGRFAEQHWDRSETVPLTTLDKAIERFGIPDFIKIDVEGHELKVIQGLSQPVSMLSLEFASESLDSLCACVDHLAGLGPYEFRLSLGESMQFEGEAWLDPERIKQELEQGVEHDPLIWGDIYARLASQPRTS